MSKPSEAVIDLSKKLWGLGVRKGFKWGDFVIDNRGELYIVGKKPEILLNIILQYKLGPIVPIWTSCDECLRWLEEDSPDFEVEQDTGGGFGWALKEIVETDFTNYLVVFEHPSFGPVAKGKAPTLIEALLKAMVEVVKMSEKKEVI